MGFHSRRYPYHWLIVLVVLIQLALPVSAAAMSWLAEPVQSRSAVPVVQPRNASLHRAPGETREAFFMRVGQQDPERLQTAALRALEYYLNHPAPAVGPDDAFERLIEQYLAQPVVVSTSGGRWAAAQLQVAGPPSPPSTQAPVIRAAAAPDAPAVHPTPSPAAPEADDETTTAGEVATSVPPAVPAPETASTPTSAPPVPPAAPAPEMTPAVTPAPPTTVASTRAATTAPIATVAPTATRLPTQVASPAPTRPAVVVAAIGPVYAPSRETRTVGVIKISADTFTDLGGGRTQAAGNVAIGDYLPLLGANDVLTYDATSLTATITLAVKVGDKQIELFTGSITAPIGTGMATLGSDINYALSEIAGFPISAGLAISQVDLNAAVVSGSATLHLNPPGVDTTAAASFTISASGGGISHAGSLQSFSLSVAGVTLAVPQGATLADSGLQAPSVTLSLPETFGGLTTTVSNLAMTTDSFTMGDAQATFALPELRIGGAADAPVKFTSNQATLNFDEGAQSYLLTVSSMLALNLPGNATTTPASVTLGSTGGEPVLSGTLASLTLAVAGTTLAMTGLTISNDGLSVAQATLTLPAKLGGESGTVTQISITKNGLGFGAATVSLPDIKFGDGTRLKITGIQATLSQQNNQYVFTASATLQINLPGNAKAVGLSLSVDANGDISGSVTGTLAGAHGHAAPQDGVSLSLAGATLNLVSPTISTAGVSVDQATLTLPSKLGGESVTLTQISISKDGLSLGSATIGLPDIKFGDGSKLKITGIQATLAQQNNLYVFTAGATLQINLPGNAKSIGLSLSIDGNGDISGTLTGTLAAANGSSTPDATTLNLAGATLNLVSPTISTSGLSVQAATLTLPASLGSSSATVTNVTITKDGLSLGAATINFPDVKIGDGSKLKIVQISATLATAADGYTFSLGGTLQVRLPGNSQDIAITASVSTAGQISATISQLTLNIASVSLKMTGLTMNNTGLSVTSATLNLPSKLGSASGSINNVTITADGLKFGGATAQISFPDFKIGSTSGFAVTGVKATINITNNGSAYSVTLSGTIAVSIPGSSASATGSVTVDNQGNISGSVQSFSLSIAGLSLSAQNIQIASDGSFLISSAKLVLPAGFGGGYVQLNNVVIRPGGGANAVSIGGGSFQLPKISTGGFTLQVSGSLQPVAGGYQITASGTFNMPSLGGASGCSGIQVSVTLYESSSGQAVLEIEPAAERAEKPDWMVSYPAAGPAGLKLKQVSLALNCSIPIGDTGFFMTSLSGSVTLDEHSTTVSVGVEIAAGKQVAGVAVASAKAQATVTADPFSMALSGTVKVFTFTVGGASASIKPSQFTATLWINAIVLSGQATVNAWSNTQGFHLTGSATMNVGIPEGSIYKGCFTWLCCPNGHKYDGGNCWPWKVHKCQTCLCIPPSNWIVGNAAIQVGEFSTPSGSDAWGFKGSVTVLGYTAAFYVDTNGSIKVGGDVDKYKLLTPSQVRAAQARWAAAKAMRLVPAGADWIDAETGVLFTAGGEILVPVEVEDPRHVSFGMTRFGAAPGLELIRPDGVRITPLSLPTGITYTEIITYTAADQPAVHAGVALADLAPVTIASAAATVRPAGAQELILANRVASRAGVDPFARSPLGRETISDASAATARLRVVHALAEVPAVDVRLDGATLFQNIAYAAATAYVTVTAESHTVSIVPAGAAGPELASVPLNPVEGADYSAVAIGAAASPALLALTDDNVRPDRGKARVRVVHASADAPAVDLALDADGPFLFGIGYADASETVPVDAGAHDLHVRSAGTTDDLLLVPAAPLLDGRVYTVFVMGLHGQSTGPYTLRAVLSQDAAPAGRVRFIHGVQAAASLDVLVDGQPLFTGVPFASDPTADQGPYTPYAALAPGPHVLTVVASAAPAVPLGTLPVEVVSDQDMTVVAVPAAGGLATQPAQTPIQLWSANDDNTLPILGQARIRLINAWAQPRPIDLGVAGGLKLIIGLGRDQASGYVALPGGVYNLEVRDTTTGLLLASLPAELLQEGQVYSVIVRDDAALPRAEVTADQVALRTVQMAYEVDEPMAGTWQAALTGDIGEDDQYILTVTGAVADVTLNEVTAAPLTGNNALIGWQLVSSEITTTVSIFANPGPITTTLVVTASDGTTTTVSAPFYTGYIVADKLSGPPPGWTNGSPQLQSVDLSSLPSGAYHIWLQADDARTRPARVYAPAPIVVSHAWQPTWDAQLAAIPSYRTLDITWTHHPNPDVDRYVLKLGAQPGVADQSIDVGNALAYTFGGLNPAQQYILWLEGVDSDTGEVSRSKVVTATPLAAPFTVTGPTVVLPVIAGQELAVTLTLATALAPYPDGVLLFAGCAPTATIGMSTAAGVPGALAQCGAVPDGIAVIVPDGPITPTLAGVQVSLVISTANTLPDGTYTVPIVARGGGLAQQVILQLQAHRPYFRLGGPTSNSVLTTNATITAAISATGVHGATDEITLSLADVPEGLVWSFDRPVIRPGEQALVTLTDTALLTSGAHALRVLGNDGRVTDELAHMVLVIEPGFDLAAQPARKLGQADTSGTAIYALTVTGRDGWMTAVTLSVADAVAPPGGALSLSVAPLSGTREHTITVVPNSRAYLITEWAEDTPPARYIFAVKAVSGGQTAEANLELHITRVLRTYLPVVYK